MSVSSTARADALIEALPYIQKFRGTTFVIKYGGSAMDDERVVQQLLGDIVFLEAVGINPVLIHGGGKAISQGMRDAGQKPRFVNGLRVTDKEAIGIVEEVLDHTINGQLVAEINLAGGRAVGVPGKRILVGKKLPPQDEAGESVDMGFVGEVVDVKKEELRAVMADDLIPVISPLAGMLDGTVLNINADLAAGSVAGALAAEKMIYISDVPGLMRDPSRKETLIHSVTRTEIEALIRAGTITGGMLPKVESALHALRSGVQKVHFVDGRVPHAVLLEVFSADGIGTEIVG